MTTTQSCAECGTRAEPGQSFCDACGAVLSWTDRAGARTGAPAAERGEAVGGDPGRDAFSQSNSQSNQASAQGSSASDDPSARLDALSRQLDALAAGGSYDPVGAGARQEPASGEASGVSTTPHATASRAAARKASAYPSGSTPRPATDSATASSRTTSWATAPATS
ncbi:zinc ribbon domain-containing protein, partial [Streptomyces prunicolor]|nr:zinc ribbon domain-containing protein [Streptomyces prunicolor]